MDFTYDDDQLALQDAIKSLITLGTPDVPGESRWAEFAQMGLLGLPFAEADGGMGAGPIEVSLVAEQMGAALAPEPYVEAVVLARTPLVIQFRWREGHSPGRRLGAERSQGARHRRWTRLGVRRQCAL